MSVYQRLVELDPDGSAWRLARTLGHARPGRGQSGPVTAARPWGRSAVSSLHCEERGQLGQANHLDPFTPRIGATRPPRHRRSRVRHRAGCRLSITFIRIPDLAAGHRNAAREEGYAPAGRSVP